MRRDIAQHYDNIAVMDAQAGTILDQLEEDGLLDNTIVFSGAITVMDYRAINGGCTIPACMFP